MDRESILMFPFTEPIHLSISTFYCCIENYVTLISTKARLLGLSSNKQKWVRWGSMYLFHWWSLFRLKFVPGTNTWTVSHKMAHNLLFFSVFITNGVTNMWLCCSINCENRTMSVATCHVYIQFSPHPFTLSQEDILGFSL